MALNEVIEMGRITDDLELKYTSAGQAVIEFSIAVDSNFKDKSGEKHTSFFTCVAFGKTAETISRYFFKGRLIVIVGELRQERFKDRATGANRSVVKINVNHIDFCGDKANTGNSAEANKAPANSPSVVPATPPNFEDVGTEDDLPF